jgi:8-oxo-dGTP pyrophosphatase MutT (NUDIX family)
LVFFKPKAFQQAAALPYVWTPNGAEVALITSRRRKRWIVPKGWPENDRPLSQVAALEAEEEAGIVGIVADTSVGSFDYQKNTGKGYAVTCRVYVFPLLVLEQRLDWKERKQRRVGWYPIAAAVDRVSETGLCKILRKLAADPDRLTCHPVPFDRTSVLCR